MDDDEGTTVGVEVAIVAGAFGVAGLEFLTSGLSVGRPRL